MRRVGAWCLWATWILAPSLALAQDAPPPVSTLAFEQAPGAERCVDEEELRDLVAARLGRDPFVEAAPVRVEVTITPRRPGYLAVIETHAEGLAAGRRELSSSRADCRDLGDALALALSLTVDPASLMRPTRPRDEAGGAAADPDESEEPSADVEAHPDADAEADPEAHPDADAEADPEADADPGADVPPSAPSRPHDATSSPHALLTATLLASWGVAPGVSGALALGGGVRLDAFSIAVEARAELPTSERTVRGAPFVGALVPCGHIDVVALCGVFSAGAFWGEGIDVPEARTATTPYLALGARGGVEVPLGGDALVLRLYGEATFPLIGAELQVGAERVWETPAVGLALGVGIGARVR